MEYEMLVRRRIQFNNLFETTYGIVLAERDDHYDVVFQRDMTHFRGQWPKDGLTTVVITEADTMTEETRDNSIGCIPMDNGKELLVRQTPVGIELAVVDSPKILQRSRWPEHGTVKLYVRKSLHQTLQEVAESFGFVSDNARELLRAAATHISKHPANQKD